jgi:hypothetical protein
MASPIMKINEMGINSETIVATSSSLLNKCPKSSLQSNKMTVKIVCIIPLKRNEAWEDRRASSARCSPINCPTRIEAAMPMAKGKLRKRTVEILKVMM